MEYHYDQHIGVYKNAFSNEWCDTIINYFTQNPDKFDLRNSSYVNDIHGHLWDKVLKNEFLNFFNPCFNLYFQKYPYIIQPLEVVGWKIQKTLPTEGYHAFHIEHGVNPPASNRVGVWTLYLNDVEEGGETEFLYQLKRIKPQKGTLCIFPAGYTHVHRGNTPFSGEKYIMTGWLDMISPE
jgi:hypothetical protein